MTKLSALALLAALAGCSSQPAPGAETPATDAPAEAAATGSEAASTDGAAATGGGASDAPPSSTGAAGASTAKPVADKPAEAEVAKEKEALQVELSIVGKGLDDAGKSALKKAAEDRLRKGRRIALPSQKVEAARPVLATLTIEPAKTEKNGFSVKLSMTGVAKNGNCPVFDLNQKLAMEGASAEKASDVLELQQAALAAMFDELEVKAPMLKPNANCTPYK